MKSVIAKWIGYFERRPGLVVLGLVAIAAAGISLIGLTVIASDDVPTPSGRPAPAIELSPMEGQPGMPVTVTGAGWRPGDTVLVRLDGGSTGQETDVYLASATVTAEGRFAVSFVLQSVPQGDGPAQALITAASPATGAEAWAVLRVSRPTQTPVPVTATPTSTPTALPTTPTQPAPTATPSTATPTPTPTVASTPTAQPTATPVPAISGWRGEYYRSHDLTGGPALVRDDDDVDFEWGAGAPAPGLPWDGFSARWTRVLRFESGTYRFHAIVDDGVRLYVDDALAIDAWHDGGKREVTADRRLGAGLHSLRIEYYERSGDALIQVWWEKVTTYPDWCGEYWPNRTLHGSPALVRNDVAIDFDWGRGTPAAAIPADGFSARWTRTAGFDAATYRFHVLVDDGARLWVDDQLIVDSWRDGGAREVTADHALARGTHRLRVEFYEHSGDARIRVWWTKVSSPSYPDWKGTYWSNRRLKGSPALVRNDDSIDFNWGQAAAAPGLPADDFSARWSRRVTFRPGVYRFYARVDDGIRVSVDGERVIDEWHESAGDALYVAQLRLRGEHKVTVEYYERGGKARVEFWWKQVGDWPTPTATATNTPSPTATATATHTPTTPPTPTPSATPTITATATQTPTPTSSPTITPTLPPTATPTASPTITATRPTETPTKTPDPTATPSPAPTDPPTATPTRTPTATATPTASPTSTPVLTATGVQLNEVLPAPAAVDWDGDGSADERDEWIELTNTGSVAVDLGGWALDDGEAGSGTIIIPQGTVLRPGAFMVFYRRETGLVLDDAGDQVRLLAPDGTVADSVVFGAIGADRSVSRDEDGTWHTDWPPSLQAPNWPPLHLHLRGM